MQAEAASPLRPGHQGTQRLGTLGCERGELVDHHHETGQGRRDTRPPIVVEVATSPFAQQPFASYEFGVQTLQHPMCTTLVEIGHARHDMGQSRERIEGRPALVVHEDELHVLGSVPPRQTEHHQA